MTDLLDIVNRKPINQYSKIALKQDRMLMTQSNIHRHQALLDEIERLMGLNNQLRGYRALAGITADYQSTITDLSLAALKHLGRENVIALLVENLETYLNETVLVD